MSKGTLQPEDHDDIFCFWQRGMSAGSLARMYGASLPDIEAVIENQAAKHPLTSERHPKVILRNCRLRIAGLMDEYATIPSKAPVAVRVRAIDGRFRLLKWEFEIDQQLGCVPINAKQMAFMTDSDAIGRRTLEILEEHGVLTEAVLEALGREFVPDWDQIQEDGFIPPLEEPPSDDES